MNRLLAPGILLFLAGVVACSDEPSAPDPGPGLDGFLGPRAIHLAPDGRLVVAEAGTGNNDGRVSVVRPDGSERVVVLDGLPSAPGAGRPWGDIAGPSGAAMAPDGVVCAAIGSTPGVLPGHAELRCSDGLRVDLRAYEERENPDGLAVASDPFDVIARGNEGWWVSDAAANTVLYVGRDGKIELHGVFPSFGTFAVPAEGRPTGLFFAAQGTVPAASRGPRGGIIEQGGLVIALYGGALALARPVEPAEPGLVFADVAGAIAAFATEDLLYFLSAEGPQPGLLDTSRRLIWSGPGGIGFVLLPGGGFVISRAGESSLLTITVPPR